MKNQVDAVGTKYCSGVPFGMDDGQTLDIPTKGRSSCSVIAGSTRGADDVVARRYTPRYIPDWQTRILTPASARNCGTL
jgi:hypothetical protein